MITIERGTSSSLTDIQKRSASLCFTWSTANCASSRICASCRFTTRWSTGVWKALIWSSAASGGSTSACPTRTLTSPRSTTERPMNSGRMHHRQTGSGTQSGWSECAGLSRSPPPPWPRKFWRPCRWFCHCVHGNTLREHCSWLENWREQHRGRAQVHRLFRASIRVFMSSFFNKLPNFLWDFSGKNIPHGGRWHRMRSCVQKQLRRGNEQLA